MEPEYPPYVESSHRVDSFTDTPVEGKMRLQYGTDIPVRIIRRFNDLVYHM